MGTIFDSQPEDVIVGADRLRSHCARMYQSVGLSAEDAAVVADRQVWADLRAVYSHGTRLLPRYIESFQQNQFNPRPNIAITREGPAFAVIDGDGSIGHVSARRAMEVAIEKARRCGIGVVTVANTYHFGAASAYSILAAEQGMIGFTTSSGGPPNVLPFGGREPGISNNPLSWAIPAGSEPPIVLDMGCGVAAHNHVGTLKLYGQPLPEGWMLTKDGRPAKTWDEAIYMLPAAGPKGMGLALTTSALSTLCGGLMPTSKKTAGSQEQFLLAIDIGQFTDRDEYVAEIGRAAVAIRAIPPAVGFDRVYLPGEIEWLRSQRWSETGIPLHRDHVDALEKTAASVGITESLAGA